MQVSRPWVWFPGFWVLDMELWIWTRGLNPSPESIQCLCFDPNLQMLGFPTPSFDVRTEPGLELRLEEDF